MAMRPCEKCYENRWKFELIDGWVKATCELCGYEVEFETKRSKKVRTVGIGSGLSVKFMTEDGILKRWDGENYREVAFIGNKISYVDNRNLELFKYDSPKRPELSGFRKGSFDFLGKISRSPKKEPKPQSPGSL